MFYHFIHKNCTAKLLVVFVLIFPLVLFLFCKYNLRSSIKEDLIYEVFQYRSVAFYPKKHVRRYHFEAVCRRRCASKWHSTVFTVQNLTPREIIMFLVGLTGSVGTGKSTVSQVLLSLGVPIIDADQIARDGKGILEWCSFVLICPIDCLIGALFCK